MTAVRNSGKNIPVRGVAPLLLRGDASSELLDRYFSAIRNKESVVKAFIRLMDSDQFRESSMAATGPLRGLPVAIKDNIDTADFATGYGSPIYVNNQPPADAPIVSMVRAAGGVLLGKTHCTEFAFAHPPPTTNPHNAGYTPGGSSSGSAAAVAAGMVPFALGTQTAGSIIRPASYCGVAGFKPSFGLLPTSGIKCFSWSLDTAGVLAATVEDCAYFAAAMTGLDLEIGDDRNDAADWKPRIAVVRSLMWDRAEEATIYALEAAADRASLHGATVEFVEIDRGRQDVYDAQLAIQDYEFARSLAFEYTRHRTKLSDVLLAKLEGGARITGPTYDKARQTAADARGKFAEAMKGFDFILTPSSPGMAPKGLGSTGAATFNGLWTLLGWPCVNVPGLTFQGMPIGVQVVAPYGADKLSLKAGRWLERGLCS